ncbi:hypothetical protein MNBD_UNCLBAC01-734 [hydrothermal vent metagenome]|uniref:Transposase n=1 Tax=hydrothermal vent metagenome TaxID=652676 RepID=A0A3B1E526_9ZZZZ
MLHTDRVRKESPYEKEAKRQRGKKQKNQERIRDKQRKYLSADAMFAKLKYIFSKIPEHHQGDIKIPLADVMMSAFAMFSLKDPSLLAFDERRESEPTNLRTIYNIDKIPCDTQMRNILDDADPEDVRAAYKAIFNDLQRGKALEPMVFMEDCYLTSVDGTGYFSSGKLHSKNCMEKIDKRQVKSLSTINNC